MRGSGFRLVKSKDIIGVIRFDLVEFISIDLCVRYILVLGKWEE